MTLKGHLTTHQVMPCVRPVPRSIRPTAAPLWTPSPFSWLCRQVQTTTGQHAHWHGVGRSCRAGREPAEQPPLLAPQNPTGQGGKSPPWAFRNNWDSRLLGGRTGAKEMGEMT